MSDQYDPRVAFDDVYDGGTVITNRGHADIVGVSHDLLRLASRRRARRRAARRLAVVGSEEDTTQHTFQPYIEVVGADGSLFESIRKSFASDMGDPKLMRSDTDESYVEFRAARRAPYEASLGQKLALLQRQFAAHVADGHGGQSLDDALDDALIGDSLTPAALTSPTIVPAGGVMASADTLLPTAPTRDLDLSELGTLDWNEDYHDIFEGRELEGTDSVIGALREEARRGGTRIPLPVRRGAAEAWQDRDEVLVSLKLPDRILTSGTRIAPFVEEMVGCAAMLGLDLEEIIGVGPFVAPTLAATSVLNELCGAATIASRMPRRGLAAIEPMGDAKLAAAMTLVQGAQQGNQKAIQELLRIAASHDDVLQKAIDRLKKAQSAKARRRA